MLASDLQRIGIDIVRLAIANNNGKTKLSGAYVIVTDLIASVAWLILAALTAKGMFIIDWIYSLERGYVDLINKLSLLVIKMKKKI